MYLSSEGLIISNRIPPNPKEIILIISYLREDPDILELIEAKDPLEELKKYIDCLNLEYFSPSVNDIVRFFNVVMKIIKIQFYS